MWPRLSSPSGRRARSSPLTGDPSDGDFRRVVPRTVRHLWAAFLVMSDGPARRHHEMLGQFLIGILWHYQARDAQYRPGIHATGPQYEHSVVVRAMCHHEAVMIGDDNRPADGQAEPLG